MEGKFSWIRQRVLRLRNRRTSIAVAEPLELPPREKAVGEVDHFMITVRRLPARLDADAHVTMAAHKLIVSSDGHLSIEGRQQSRTFSPEAWDAFEVKRLSGKARTRSR